MLHNRKPIPRSVLIFGASGHIGGPLADFLSREAPTIRLRLATRDAANVNTLGARHPGAEVVQADYNDRASLDRAVRDIEGLFVLTSAGTDEAPSMKNLVEALRSARAEPHIIRLLGMQPEQNPHLIPKWLQDHRLGLPIQHPIAKKILDDSLLPVTYVNIGATFMDNITRYMAPALRARRTLVWPERLIPYINPAEIAEVAGRLFLSEDRRHFGQFHTLNNGQDILLCSELAALMSEAWGEPIAFDGSKAAFFAQYAYLGEGLLHYLWEFFEYEAENSLVWSRNDFVERMLGRKPMSVREWLIAHRRDLLGK